MFCIYCAAENQHEGKFCHKCGNSLYTTESATPTPQVESDLNVPPKEPSTGTAMPYAEVAATKYGLLVAYGLLFIIGGFACVVLGFYATGEFAAVLSWGQGVAFCVAGVAVIERSRAALSLVWLTVASYALGVIARGLKPIEILILLMTAGAAVWFTRVISNLGTRVQRFTIGSACVGVALVILFITTGTFPPDDPYAKFAAPSKANSSASAKHDSGRIGLILKLSDNPEWLIGRCGTPVSDKSANLFSITTRDISYLDSDGKPIVFSYLDGRLNPRVSGYRTYDIDQDLDNLVSVLPCLVK
jgi:hypothetical protein